MVKQAREYHHSQKFKKLGFRNKISKQLKTALAQKDEDKKESGCPKIGTELEKCYKSNKISFLQVYQHNEETW